MTTEKKFWIGLTFGGALLVGAVFFVGDMLECEFPYFLTLRQVRHAKTVHGERARDAIARQLGTVPDSVQFHRCSYCKNIEPDYPKGMIRVQILNNTTGVFGFAYAPDQKLLYPADEATAEKFPKLGPSVVQMKK